ncbi:MAG TPA: DUF3151 domain-containing protein [Microthrixaceae bacterium]|nr:DUF3151 domain-containing protein [Microthrixaceae bacterium]
MSDSMVDFSPTGPRETVLPDLPEPFTAMLGSALSKPEDKRREAVSAVAGAFPKISEGWGQLGRLARDPVEAYAYFRIGYHRGLDALRGAGWKGSGPVRWEHESNRGFLRCLDGLRQMSAALGESDETLRCEEFLNQCDPNRPEPLPFS